MNDHYLEFYNDGVYGHISFFFCWFFITYTHYTLKKAPLNAKKGKNNDNYNKKSLVVIREF